MKICIDCNKQLYKGNKSGFCFKCYWKNFSNPPHICIDCGKEVKNYYADKCRNCSNKFYSGKNHWSYNKVTTKCNTCYKDICLKLSVFKNNKTHYCSGNCYYESLKYKSSSMLGKHHTEETKNKMSVNKKGQHNSPKTEFKKGIKTCA